MPHLCFRGCDESFLEKLTPALVADLASIFDCPPDWVTVESMATRLLTRPPLPWVEVVWFERGSTVRDRAALALAAPFARAGAPVPTVVFRAVAPADYYEDGRPSVG